jgi:hypothetical protein
VAVTAQPPLPLVPDGVRPVGAAAATVEDNDGWRVYVHGNLAYAWDAGDAAGRRFAAVSLTRIKAAAHPPRRIRVENGPALLIVLCVPGAAINQAQREALTCSTFRKSIANKPLWYEKE